MNCLIIIIKGYASPLSIILNVQYDTQWTTQYVITVISFFTHFSFRYTNFYILHEEIIFYCNYFFVEGDHGTLLEEHIYFMKISSGVHSLLSRVAGEMMCSPALAAPAPSPISVIWLGSPRKAWMFSRTNSSANSWSHMPQLPVACSSSVVRKPEGTNTK